MQKLYLFLDFDGVMNNAEEDYGREDLGHFNKRNIESFGELVEELIKEYDLRIVINSSWKMNVFKGDENWLSRFIHKIPPLVQWEKYIIDTTPTYGFWTEGYDCKRFEVEAWIVQRLLDDRDKLFLIIDDEEVLTNGTLNFIKVYRTDTNKGLVNSDIKNIVDLLHGGNDETVK